MNEIKTLALLELCSLYDLNKLRYSYDRKEKNQARLLCFARVFVLVVFASYVVGMTYGLCSLGLSEMIPAYLSVLVGLIVLMFGIFRVGHNIFSHNGIDILSSLPIKKRSIVFSRFLVLYLEDLVFTLVVLLPSLVVYGIMVRPGTSFFVLSLLLGLLLPAIPLVIALLFGTLVMAVSARLKHKNMIQTALMLVFVVAVLFLSFGLRSMEDGFQNEMLLDLAESFGNLVGKLYLPAKWFSDAVLGLHIGSVLLFLLVSVGSVSIAIALVVKYFDRIMQSLLSIRTKKDYKIGAMESRSLLKTLFLREMKRYFSSSIYVTNTIIGPIMACIMAVALCVAGENAVSSFIPSFFSVDRLLPFLFSTIFCMMTTTATSISMEGKQFWLIKSLPIPTKTLFDSKILLNLCVMAPFYLISEVAFVIAARPTVMELIWLVLVPLCFLLFAAVIGISANIKWHSFDWAKEEQVVKQSASAMLGGFAGALLALVGTGVVLVTPAQQGNYINAGLCVLVVALTVLLYRKNNKVKLAKL